MSFYWVNYSVLLVSDSFALQFVLASNEFCLLALVLVLASLQDLQFFRLCFFILYHPIIIFTNILIIYTKINNFLKLLIFHFILYSLFCLCKVIKIN